MNHGQTDICPGNCGTKEDCFNQPCKRYGARIKITYIVDGNDNTRQNYDQLTERQTGEQFKSRAPPDCRIVAG